MCVYVCVCEYVGVCMCVCVRRIHTDQYTVCVVVFDVCMWVIVYVFMCGYVNVCVFALLIHHSILLAHAVGDSSMTHGCTVYTLHCTVYTILRHMITTNRSTMLAECDDHFARVLSRVMYPHTTKWYPGNDGIVMINLINNSRQSLSMVHSTSYFVVHSNVLIECRIV